MYQAGTGTWKTCATWQTCSCKLIIVKQGHITKEQFKVSAKLKHVVLYRSYFNGVNFMDFTWRNYLSVVMELFEVNIKISNKSILLFNLNKMSLICTQPKFWRLHCMQQLCLTSKTLWRSKQNQVLRSDSLILLPNKDFVFFVGVGHFKAMLESVDAIGVWVTPS